MKGWRVVPGESGDEVQCGACGNTHALIAGDASRSIRLHECPKGAGGAAQLTKRLADAEARVAAVESLLGPGDHARWGGEPDGYLVPMSAILAALEARAADESWRV